MKLSQSFVSFDPLKPGPVSFCRSNITSSSIQSNVCFLTPCLCPGLLKDVPVGLKFPRINFSSQVIYIFVFSWKAKTSECLNGESWHSKNRHCVPLKAKKKKKRQVVFVFCCSRRKNSLSFNKLGENQKRLTRRVKRRPERKRRKSVNVKNILAQRVSCFGCLSTFFSDLAKDEMSKLCVQHNTKPGLLLVILLLSSASLAQR